MTRRLAAVLMTLAAFAPLGAIASDHSDAPAGTPEPSADLGDLFAWTSEDGTRLNLILTVRGMTFADVGLYVFNLASGPRYGEVTAQYQIVCGFDHEQHVECWAGDDDYAQGDARSEAGLTSRRRRMRIFTGPRDDPFFFNRTGLEATLEQMRGLRPRMDEAGCPELELPDAEALSMQLGTAPGGGAAIDAHDAEDVLAIVIQIDKQLVTRGGPFVAVWASTHARR
jgi:hypothetical protein